MGKNNENGNTARSAGASEVVEYVSRSEFAELLAKFEAIASAVDTAFSSIDTRLSRLEGADKAEGDSVSERVERLEFVANKWNSGDLMEFDRTRRERAELAERVRTHNAD